MVSIKSSLSYAHFVILAFFCMISFAIAGKSNSPNIVFLLSDDQTYTDYSFMDHPIIKTPRIDKLAAESVVFKRGYVPVALCRPSIMSMVTGHYPHTHLVTGNDPSPKYFKGEEFSKAKAKLISNVDRFRIIPKILVEEKGYLAHQSGKWWEGNYKRGGFTHGMTRGFPQKGGRHGDDGLKIGREGIQEIVDFLDLAEKEDKPFFLFYAPFLPHTPHNPPKEYLDKYKDKVDSLYVAKYYAMVEWFDFTCGQVVDEIEKRGMKKDTIFVYLTDNGWIQSEDNKKYAPRSKQSANEGGTRTPIFYTWEGQWAPQDRPELSTSLDIYPTLCDALGIEIKEDLPGISLIPALEKGKPIKRDAIFGESFAHDIVDLDNPEKTLLYRWVIEGDWKLLLSYDGEVNRYTSSHPKIKGPQLYNLSKDPNENKNLAKKYPNRVKALRKKLNDWYLVQEVKTL
jgi:uncharacterized sulfatase